MYTIYAGKKREEGEEERVLPAFQNLDYMKGILAHWKYIYVNCNFLEKKEIPLAMRSFFFETYFIFLIFFKFLFIF